MGVEHGLGGELRSRLKTSGVRLQPRQVVDMLSVAIVAAGG